jgi:F-type H+-transporting ATPase subunit a
MPEQLWFTKILNHAFAGPVDLFLGFVQGVLHLPVAPRYAQAPISNTVAMEVLVIGLLLMFFIFLRVRLSVESPGGLQHTIEGFQEFIEGESSNIIGHGSERFTTFLAALFLFILIGNLFGVIPTLASPTAFPVVPLGLALCTFGYYQVQGLREHGISYLKQFLGPVWWLAILMLPLEIISHLARLLSLTIRLYANMFAGELVTLVFLSLVPIGIPVIFLGLHIFVALLQAYIFALLAMVYLAGAVAAEH